MDSTVSSILSFVTPNLRAALLSFEPNGGNISPLQILQTGKYPPACLLLVTASILASLFVLNWFASYHDGIPTVNRRFALEPSIFSRIRWAFNAKDILENAHKKFQGQPYRLARGDIDVLILPPHLVPELNRLNGASLSSLKYQCHSIMAHCNELQVVLQSDFHIKMLLQRGTPSLPLLASSFGERAQASIQKHFPTCAKSWMVAQPLPKIALCVSQLSGLLLLGTPVSDDEKLIELFLQITRMAFFIAFAMRLIPRVLQPFVLWLLPVKWSLRHGWNELDKIVVPELEQRKLQDAGSCLPNVASWMILEGKGAQRLSLTLINRLIGTAFAGGIWSTSTLVFGVINDLLGRPDVLEEIRTEIRMKHTEINGQWDFAALNSLGKLDSAMKETSRMAPGSLLIYGRVVQKEFALSNGLLLQRGQHLATAPHTHVPGPDLNPDLTVYDPFRWYNADPEAHLTRPFFGLTEVGRFGSGRRACPGRFLASMIAKVMLTKLLDEYEFAYVDGRRPPVLNMHEFVYMHPNSRIQMRGREDSSGIVFG